MMNLAHSNHRKRGFLLLPKEVLAPKGGSCYDHFNKFWNT